MQNNMPPISRVQMDAVKEFATVYANFMVATHRLTHLGSNAYEGKLEEVHDSISSNGAELCKLQRQTGIVMFLDLRSLLCALTGIPHDQDCRRVAAA